MRLAAVVVVASVLLIGVIMVRTRVPLWLGLPWGERSVFMEDASLSPMGLVPVADVDYPARGVQCVRLLAMSHRVASGTKLVVVDRVLRNPKAWVFDDEEFELLSMEFPKEIVGVPVTLPSPDLEVRYSTGRMSGIHRCIGGIGYEVRGGQFLAEFVDEELRVSVDLEVPLYESGRDQPATVVRVRRQLNAYPGRAEDLLKVFGDILLQVKRPAAASKIEVQSLGPD